MIETYREFWPHYLREHRRPATRALHLAGTSAAVIFVAAAVIAAEPLFLLGSVAAGYAPSWIGHAFIEHNRPATFGHPLWSFISDFRMAALMLAGKLPGEMKRLGITEDDASYRK